MNQNKNVSFALKVGLIGMIGGFFGGLLGIGGSFLVIPFLIRVLGLSHHRAHASTLPVSFLAILVRHYSDNLAWRHCSKSGILKLTASMTY
jgi:uncharacterized membrane protein YfcA